VTILANISQNKSLTSYQRAKISWKLHYCNISKIITAKKRVLTNEKQKTTK